MNKQETIAQLAEHREASPTKNFETVSLGETNTKKPVKITPKQKDKHDRLEDAKNRVNLSYDDAGDLF